MDEITRQKLDALLRDHGMTEDILNLPATGLLVGRAFFFVLMEISTFSTKVLIRLRRFRVKRCELDLPHNPTCTPSC